MQIEEVNNAIEEDEDEFIGLEQPLPQLNFEKHFKLLTPILSNIHW